MGEFAVYKYVYEDRVIYVGKTNASLKARIDAHSREESFKPYMAAKIWYCELSNEVETDSVEKVLINLYKPEINIKDKVPLLTGEVALPDLKWIPYEEYKPLNVRLKLAKERAAKEVAFVDALSESGGCEFTLSFIPEITFAGSTSLIEKDISFDGSLYHFKPTKEGYKMAEENYHSLVFYCTSFLVPLIKNKEKYELLLGFVREVQKYILGGYVSEWLEDQFSLFIPSRYEAILDVVSKITGITPKKYGTHYELEWCEEHNSFLEDIRDAARYEIVKQARIEELIH